MSCKHLEEVPDENRPEIGGSVNPSEPPGQPIYDCKLGRLRFPREARRCEEISPEGPCWRWQEEKPGQVDTEF